MGAAGLPVYTGQLGGSQVPRGGCRKRAHSPIEPCAHRPLCPPPSPAWPLPQTQPLFWLQQGCFPGLSTLRSGAGLCCIPGREGIQPRCRPAAALAQLAEKGGDFSRMEDISLPAPCTLGGSCSTVGCFSPSQNWDGLGLKMQIFFFFYCNRDHSSTWETKNAQNSSAELQAPSLGKQRHPDPTLGSSSQRLRGKD